MVDSPGKCWVLWAALGWLHGSWIVRFLRGICLNLRRESVKYGRLLTLTSSAQLFVLATKHSVGYCVLGWDPNLCAELLKARVLSQIFEEWMGLHNRRPTVRLGHPHEGLERSIEVPKR